MEGLTFDTGVLIGIERARRLRSSTSFALELLVAAQRDRLDITIPSIVVGEWWQARPGQSRAMLDGMTIEMLDRDLAEKAGAVCGQLKHRDRKGRERLYLVDAIVLVSAARRGDRVYTADPLDLGHLRDTARLDVEIVGI